MNTLTVPIRYLARCARCRQVHAREFDSAADASHFINTVTNYDNLTRCSCGRALMRWNRVRGRVSAHPCDARCTTAGGPDCECSCGGKNHGIDYV